MPIQLNLVQTFQLLFLADSAGLVAFADDLEAARCRSDMMMVRAMPTMQAAEELNNASENEVTQRLKLR